MHTIRIEVDSEKSEVQSRGIRTVPIKQVSVYESCIDKDCVVFVGIGKRLGSNRCLKIPKSALVELAKQIQEVEL